MAKMPEKPTFSVVSDGTVSFQPPRPLGPHGRALWDKIQREYAISDAPGCELLCQACASLDTAESLGEAIARDGHVIYSRAGVPRPHPAIKDQLACRSFTVKTLERLGVTTEGVKPAAGHPLRGGLGVLVPPR